MTKAGFDEFVLISQIVALTDRVVSHSHIRQPLTAILEQVVVAGNRLGPQLELQTIQRRGRVAVARIGGEQPAVSIEGRMRAVDCTIGVAQIEVRLLVGRLDAHRLFV